MEADKFEVASWDPEHNAKQQLWESFSFLEEKALEILSLSYVQDRWWNKLRILPCARMAVVLGFSLVVVRELFLEGLLSEAAGGPVRRENAKVEGFVGGGFEDELLGCWFKVIIPGVDAS
ncbi:hypothetical protein Droror1_Dr00021723 [Drosera rotundifolia]